MYTLVVNYVSSPKFCSCFFISCRSMAPIPPSSARSGLLTPTSNRPPLGILECQCHPHHRNFNHYMPPFCTANSPRLGQAFVQRQKCHPMATTTSFVDRSSLPTSQRERSWTIIRYVSCDGWSKAPYVCAGTLSLTVILALYTLHFALRRPIYRQSHVHHHAREQRHLHTRMLTSDRRWHSFSDRRRNHRYNGCFEGAFPCLGHPTGVRYRRGHCHRVDVGRNAVDYS